MRIALCLIAIALCAGSAAQADDGFAGIQPILQEFCYRCHGNKQAKANINLEAATAIDHIQKDPDTWDMVSIVVLDGDMPPEGEPQPTQPQRDQLVATVDHAIESLDNVVDPGRVLIRRLNRTEYNNTIRDLLGVDARPADQFPADGGGGEGFDNNAHVLFVPPILMEKYLTAAANVLDQADPARIITTRPGEKTSERDAAAQSLRPFITRAFRRPATDGEVQRYLKLYDQGREAGQAFEPALKLAMKAVLVSPSFLFRVEQDQPTPGVHPISHYEMATRLSYFIWSSMPDDELFRLAAEEKLHDPAVLEQQVRRMLKHEKSQALAEQFAGQWLHIRELKHSAQGPDRRKFPEYTESVQDAMVAEAITFFRHLLTEDRPVLELLHADYTFVNEELAKLYNVDGVTGPELRKVSLKDPNRGGVLGMAAVLVQTSYPRRTSPVLRGKWVLEQIMGTPPPPPPPSVDVLPQDDHPRDGLTFRQRLEEHRSKKSCASCHAKLDPLGFALECFDTIGRYRTEIGGVELDTSGKLPSGEVINGPHDLKQVLLNQKRDLFVRNLVEKMLGYALGRGLEYYDAGTVKKIAAALAEQDYRSSVLISEIVKSLPFRHRRSEPIAEATP